MNKFAFLALALVGLLVCSCENNDIATKEQVIVPKESNRQYAPIGCVHFTNGTVDRWGVRCFSNRGNCKRASECIWLSDIIINNILRVSNPSSGPNLGNWDGYKFDSKAVQLELYKYDPDLFFHPDSVN